MFENFNHEIHETHEKKQKENTGHPIAGKRHADAADSGLRGGKFCAFRAAGVAEIAEAAFFHRAIRQFHRELRRPAGLGFGHLRDHADGAGKFVDHDFAKKAFAGGGNFCFAHARSVAKNPARSMSE
jgi:hypothetical protein